jgi:hypothetical protein
MGRPGGVPARVTVTSLDGPTSLTSSGPVASWAAGGPERDLRGTWGWVQTAATGREHSVMGLQWLVGLHA